MTRDKKLLIFLMIMQKKLQPKQMLQILPIALAQVKAGNNSETLQNELGKLFTVFISQNKSLKRSTMT